MAGDIPFRRWEWIECWWRHYGETSHLDAPESDLDRRLLLPAVFDDGEWIGVGPWQLVPTGQRQHTIRFLGDGEVCSDYLGILALPGRELQVAAALAAWLEKLRAPSANRGAAGWNRLEMNAVYEHDPALRRLLEGLSDAGCSVHVRRGPTCWRIELA